MKYRKSRGTCYSPSDIKWRCSKCDAKNFISRNGFSNNDVIQSDCHNCQRNGIEINLSKQQEWYGKPMIPKAFELIYDDVASELKIDWPNAQIKRTYDEIHGTRTTIEIVGTHQRDLDKYLTEKGLGAVAFGIQMELRTNPSYIRAILNELGMLDPATTKK